MEPCQFTPRLQARLMKELINDLGKHSEDRINALEQDIDAMLKEPESKWFSVEGVANDLSVSKETVRRWLRSGQLKAYRAGRQYRIKPEDLQAFLDQHNQSAELSA